MRFSARFASLASFGRKAVLVALALALAPAFNAGCGEALPRTTAPATTTAPVQPKTASVAAEPEEAEPPLPELRTGGISPIDHSRPLIARTTARQVSGDAEILQLELRIEGEGYTQVSQFFYTPTTVSVQASDGGPQGFSFIDPQGPNQGSTIWVRRRKSEAGKPVKGDLYIAQGYGERGASPGHHFRFEAADTSSAPTAPALADAWALSLANRLRFKGVGGPWHEFAAERVLALRSSSKKDKAAPAPRGVRPAAPTRLRDDELATLMETTTGVTSIQETLQHDRGLFLAAARGKPSVPIGKVQRPELAAHPFKEMLAALPASGAPAPAEPLAAAAPADFYFVRFGDLPTLFRLVDQLDAWGTPLAHALDSRAETRDLSARYEASLGLSRGPLSRALGPDAIASVAIVGSDPYLKEGSDVTAIFKVKSRGLFEAGLAMALGAHSASHGAMKSETTSYGGASIKVTRSADGAVAQHRISSGELEIVSNSMGATKAVLDAISGKRARLADEADFQYMLARDAKTRADVLAFMSDRFVAEVIGPRQKILEARRQIALAELVTPGYAALLHGWLEGKSPASVEDLIKTGLLSKDDLKHGSGEAIAWRPGEAARSSWGTPAALTPLIDLPAPALVTEAERAGYERFARGYQSYWSTYIDPVMIRLAVDSSDTSDAAQTITADVRILPLIDGSEYREIERAVGTRRVNAPAATAGARVVLGVAEDAGIRRDLGRLSGGFGGRHNLTIDWLGDWAMLGVADRPSAIAAVTTLEKLAPERPMTEAELEKERERQRERRRDGDDDLVSSIGKAPLFAAIGLKSMAGAALMITAARGLAQEAMPGLITWGEWESHRTVPIVRVSVREERQSGASGRPINIYYAFCKGALVLSLKPDVMRDLLDERLDGKAPGPAPDAKSGETGAPQLVIDIAPKERGAIWTLLTWALEQRAIAVGSRSQAAAEALFRGAPERAGDPAAMRALALAIGGAAPVTPDGGVYSMGPEGVRDPARGSAYSPQWPALPVPGSPVEKALAKLSLFRVELGFDDEQRPKGSSERMRSLHARVTLKQ